MSSVTTPQEPPSALALAPRPTRPTAHRGASVSAWRFVRAYTTTFAVIASYVWLGLRARVLGRAWRDANIGDVHTRNARKVYATILRLQGLFIKVGQLLSSMSSAVCARPWGPGKIGASASSVATASASRAMAS